MLAAMWKAALILKILLKVMLKSLKNYGHPGQAMG